MPGTLVQEQSKWAGVGWGGWGELRARLSERCPYGTRLLEEHGVVFGEWGWRRRAFRPAQGNGRPGWGCYLPVGVKLGCLNWCPELPSQCSFWACQDGAGAEC